MQNSECKSEYPFPVLSDSKNESVFEPFPGLFVGPKPDAFAAAAGRFIPVIDFTNGYMVIPQRSAALDQCGQNFSTDSLSAVMGISDDNGHIVLPECHIPNGSEADRKSVV